MSRVVTPLGRGLVSVINVYGSKRRAGRVFGETRGLCAAYNRLLWCGLRINLPTAPASTSNSFLLVVRIVALPEEPTTQLSIAQIAADTIINLTPGSG